MEPSISAHHPSWVKALNSFDRQLYRIEKLTCALSLLVMLIATSFNVAIRNFGWNLPNYGEYGLAALVPLTLIGGAMCTYLGAHISIEIMQVMPRRFLRELAHAAAAVATIVFALFYVYSGWVLIEEFLLTNDKLLDMGTPLWILAVFFPVGMILMIWHSLVRILTLLVDLLPPLWAKKKISA